MGTFNKAIQVRENEKLLFDIEEIHYKVEFPNKKELAKLN